MNKVFRAVLAVLFASVFVVPTAAGETLSANLQTGLVLWLDAGANVINGEFNGKSGVVHWCDVREGTIDSGSYASHTFDYPVASATTTTPYANLKGGLVPPTLQTDTATGKKYIDFGLYGSSGGNNNWMFVENGSGALQPVVSRSLFAVVSFGQANNFGTHEQQWRARLLLQGATWRGRRRNRQLGRNHAERRDAP